MKKILCVLLCLLLASLPLGCGKKDSTTPATVPTGTTGSQDSLSAAKEIFSQAKNAILSTENQILSYTVTQNRTIHTQAFSEKVTGTASFSAIGSDAFDAIVEEQLVYGTYSSEYRESYCGGNAYCTVSGRTFSALMTPEAFIQRQLPAVLMDETLYGSISTGASATGYLFMFSAPTALESWVTDQEATLVSASGTATVSAEGILTQTTYRAQYTIGDAAYSLDVTMRITTPESLDLSVLHPDHTQNCVQIASLDAPKFLLRSVGDLFSSTAIASTSREFIESEAVPITHIRSSTYYLSGAGSNFAAAIRHSTEYQDYRNESILSKEQRIFLGGVSTYTGKDGIPIMETAVTATDVRTQVEDAILSALFALQYISDAQIIDEGGSYYISFTGNAAYCNDLYATLERFLGVDLDGTATRHEDTKAGGFLTIDKATLLPTDLGMQFSRVHSFGKVKYALNYELHHALDLASTNADNEIINPTQPK